MPLYQQFKTDNELQIGIWRISETENQFRQNLQSAEINEDCRDFHSERRRLERYAIRALLAEMTGQFLRIDYYENGAPFLPDSMYHISISHTNGFAAVALHLHRKPGIDIELPSPRILHARSRVFSQKEIELTSSGNQKEQEVSATLCWCAKETIFKIAGREVYDYATKLTVQPFTLQSEGKLTVMTAHKDKFIPLSVSYTINKDFILTWSAL